MMRSTLKFRVETPSGFSFHSVVQSHGWHQLEPFSLEQGGDRLVRVHQMDSGQVVRLDMLPAADGIAVEVAAGRDLDSSTAQEELTRAVRSMFQLGIDLSEFYELISGLARYQWVAKSGHGRLLRSPTVWEDLVKTLMTTNTAWAATRKMVERIVALGPGDESTGRAFPGPDRIAALEPDELSDRVRAGYRSAYLHELAAAINGGDIDVESWASDSLTGDELYQRIREIKGFGPYAAGVVMMLLGRHDRISLDTAARAMFKRTHRPEGKLRDKDIHDHYQQYGDWKGLILWMDVLQAYSDGR